METPRTEIRRTMGYPPAFNDRFRRPSASGMSGGPGPSPAGTAKAGQSDAFARSPGSRADAFASMRRAGTSPVDHFVSRAQRTDPPAPARQARSGLSPSPGPGLRVVADRDAAHSRAPAPGDAPYRHVTRESAWSRRPARSSSLVLVSGAPVLALTEQPEPPPPAPALDTASPASPLILAQDRPSSRRSGGGGGPPRTPRPGFSQDDFVGVALGMIVLFLLLLWIVRGGQPAQDIRVVNVASAMNDPITLPAAPPAPPPLAPGDPFGATAIDLTPKDPSPVAGESAPALQSAPAPASPGVQDRTLHAWFCTSGAALTEPARKWLERELTDVKGAFAGQELVVRGYADTRGSTSFNTVLGSARARVVADFLRTKGLKVVDEEGVGELSGIDDNANCSNQRRVDVFLKGGSDGAPSRACLPEPSLEELTCR